MFGQTKPYDPHQKAVDQFVQENNVYGPKEPLRFNLRAYLQYVDEHHITNPDDIPEEVIAQFRIGEEQLA